MCVLNTLLFSIKMVLAKKKMLAEATLSDKWIADMGL